MERIPRSVLKLKNAFLIKNLTIKLKIMKNLKQIIVLAAFSVMGFDTFSQSSMGVIKGQILNNDHEPVVGAVIKILQGGSLIGGTSTDTEGLYTYKPLNAGNYDV